MYILRIACNLTSFSPCLTGPADYLFASRHKGIRFKSPGVTYVKPGFSYQRCLATICSLYIYIYSYIYIYIYKDQVNIEPERLGVREPSKSRPQSHIF